MKTIYEPLAGEHISNACSNAIQQAQRINKNVGFTFNGVSLVATPRSDAKKLVANFDRYFEQERKKPLAPATVLALREIEQKKEAAQSGADRALGMLPDAIEAGLDHLIVWVDFFTSCGDWTGVNYHCEEIASLLRDAGYGGFDYHNREPAWYCTRERMGRWIINEVVNQLNHGLPPHGLMNKFCEKYFDLEAHS